VRAPPKTLSTSSRPIRSKQGLSSERMFGAGCHPTADPSHSTSARAPDLEFEPAHPATIVSGHAGNLPLMHHAPELADGHAVCERGIRGARACERRPRLAPEGIISGSLDHATVIGLRRIVPFFFAGARESRARRLLPSVDERVRYGVS